MFFFLFLFCVRACGYCRCALGEILSICETPGWLHALENVTPAYINVGVSSERVEFQFWVNFKLQSVEKMQKCATIVNFFFFMNFSKLNVRIILYAQHFNVFNIRSGILCYFMLLYFLYMTFLQSRVVFAFLLIVTDLVFLCSLSNAVLNESLFHELDV